MSSYTKFLRSIALPAGSRIAGYQDVMPYLRELEESQWWPLERLRALQNQKLRRLIAHVYQHVPFYHELMERRGLTPADIQTTDDLVRLPIVDKPVLIRNFPDGLRDYSIPQRELIQATSSGSTGERLVYWTTKQQKAKKWAGLFRWWELAGWEFGRPYTTMTMAPNQGLRGIPGLSSLEWLMLRHRWISAAQITDEIMAENARKLAHDRPELFRSYASTMFLLAESMLRQGINVPIPAITTTGETLTDDMRASIEQAFRPGRVFNEYGGDGMQIACECSQHQGLHINAETCFVEIVRDGQRVPDGELGEVVLTNLEAAATPFIRYNIKDVAVLDQTPCACGRGLPRFRRLEGRLTDLFLSSDGHWLTVHQFTGFFARHMPSVKAFQVVQRQVDDVLIRLVVTDEFGDADRERMIETFSRYLGPNNHFTLEYVDEIPLTPSGKRRFFISEAIQGTGNTLEP